MCQLKGNSYKTGLQKLSPLPSLSDQENLFYATLAELSVSWFCSWVICWIYCFTLFSFECSEYIHMQHSVWLLSINPSNIFLSHLLTYSSFSYFALLSGFLFLHLMFPLNKGKSLILTPYSIFSFSVSSYVLSLWNDKFRSIIVWFYCLKSVIIHILLSTLKSYWVTLSHQLQ